MVDSMTGLLRQSTAIPTKLDLSPVETMKSN